MVTSTSNTTISHAGKCDRAVTGVEAPVGAGLDFVAGMRMELSEIIKRSGTLAKPILKLRDGITLPHHPAFALTAWTLDV
jgi:hypothetical protein